MFSELQRRMDFIHILRRLCVAFAVRQTSVVRVIPYIHVAMFFTAMIAMQYFGIIWVDLDAHGVVNKNQF